MKIKEKDFVEIDYTGSIKETNQIFDLTDKETAQKNNLFDPNFKYGSRVICVGEKEILPAIDKALIGKDVPSEVKIDLKPEEAFGPRDSKLMKIIPTNDLLKQEIRPFPGLQIQVQGFVGTVRTVSTGRTTIDFNHPLAGKELIYDIKIKSIITDPKVKLRNLFENAFKLADKEYALIYDQNKVTIKLNGPEMPAELLQMFVKKAKEVIPELEITF
jgi:FKBP-type peptidyl-prolyl cis-trans isomerase 2